MVKTPAYGISLYLWSRFELNVPSWSSFYLLFTKCSMLALYIVLKNIHLASKWSNFGSLLGNIPRHHNLFNEYCDDLFFK